MLNDREKAEDDKKNAKFNEVREANRQAKDGVMVAEAPKPPLK